MRGYCDQKRGANFPIVLFQVCPESEIKVIKRKYSE